MKKLPYKEFGDRYTRKEIFIIAPVIFLFVLIVFFSDQNSFITTTLVVLIILISIIGTIWQTKRLKKFICPNCRRKISEPTIKFRSDGDPINYYC
ncbi:hypothetical protein JW960_21985, partial [candidate division KSB1 bacterium]|nr:hypothetical protein [candidate division KSB1 bacterium]